MARFSKFFLVFIITLSTLVSGCSDWFTHYSKVTEQQLDYQQRIFNLLERESDYSINAYRYPDRRTLLVELEVVSVNWSDFFNTIDCPDLQQLISERNSQVGRQTNNINSLVYELDFAQLVSDCNIDASEFSEDWHKAIELKQQQRSNAIWNYSWASQIWQSLFFIGSNKISVVQQEQVVVALTNLRKNIEADADSRSVYQNFATLEANKAALGQLINDSNHVRASLDSLNAALQTNTRALCPQNKPTQQAEYLVNVLRKFFLQKAQHQIRSTLNVLRKMEQEILQWKHFFSEQWNEELDAIIYDKNSNKLRSKMLTKSLQNHIKVWEDISKQCGIRIHQNTAR